MNWFALRTQPQREFAVDAVFRHHSIRSFLPTETMTVRRGKRKGHEREIPKLPGYLFVAEVNPWEVVRSFRGHGVTGVVGFNGVPGVIPHSRLVLYSRQSVAPLIHSRAIVAGRRAELIAPGCEHVVVDVLSVNGNTAKVLMWLFGAKREVEVKIEHLEAA